jgi:hypothetical protein
MSGDPRGPFRDVIGVDVKPNGNFVLLSCGHVAHGNPIYTPPCTSDQWRCVHCANEARSSAIGGASKPLAFPETHR